MNDSFLSPSVNVNISFHMELKQHLSCLTGAVDYAEHFLLEPDRLGLVKQAVKMMC